MGNGAGGADVDGENVLAIKRMRIKGVAKPPAQPPKRKQRSDKGNFGHPKRGRTTERIFRKRGKKICLEKSSSGPDPKGTLAGVIPPH